MTIIYSLIARDTTVLVEYTDAQGNFMTFSRVLLGRLRATPETYDGGVPHWKSYTHEGYTFHNLFVDGLIFMCMTDRIMSIKLATAFLEDIHSLWQKQYGNIGLEAIAFAMDNEFSPVLKDRMIVYNNLTDHEAQIAEISDRISKIRNVMVDNIDKIVDRGDKIHLLVDRTQQLNDEAHEFHRRAVMIKQRQLWWETARRRCVRLTMVVMLLIFIFLTWSFHKGKL
eukprot:GHVN01015041.1.p1 GENE.GHVN01015041.1~~GHVN01015041.1.p1  ORF type:complete len:226 (+),score=7.05 GHVN01015041.1:27-704(+)